MRNLTQSFTQQRGTSILSFVARLGLLTLLLVGCVAGPPSEPTFQPEAMAPDTTELEQMAKEGRFLDAALAYSKLAADAKLATGTPPALQQHYALRAAELLMSGNYVPQAYQLLNEIPADSLPADLQIRHALLSADIALTRHLPDEALTMLNRTETLLAELGEAAPGVTPTILQRFHQLRADSFAQLGNHLEVARERVQLETLLTEPEAILANQQAILAALQMLSPSAIQTLLSSSPADVLGGWLALVNIGQSISDPQQAGVDLVRWRERFPGHPALDSIITSVLAARPQMLRLPKTIALILPLSDRYAKAASAVRDGFLAAYYAQQPGDAASDRLPIKPLTPFNPEQSTAADGTDNFDTPASTVPSIKIYDAGNDPKLIDQVYQQAVDEGAEFVVGPLHKDAVNQLAGHKELPVPVLALNYSERHGSPAEQAPPENLFQLSLSPEQEARQVAERAWLDGHSRAAIITPSTDWGDRVARAFNQRWQQFGGHVVEKQLYDPQQSDYSLPIRRLLNVDESQQREKDLQNLLGTKLEFIPRRRQDIDFIFMAAASKQARLIKPQLRFHHAPKVPVYTTSHSYSGSIDADMDRDMDGVLFCDMPWTLDTDRPTHTLKADIESLWPNASKRYSRLFALGVDAYRVIGELNGLRRNRSEFYAGETGDLYLDVANRLQRRLSWAQFERGVPQRLSEF
jgi:outer membrane PBP1 activator LpoA protein